MSTIMRTSFKESDLKAIGGLKPAERRQIGIHEMVDLAVVSSPKFQEALESGRGIKRWLESAMRAASSMKEAQSEQTLGFLLRKGVQVTANNWYQTAPAAWRNYADVVGSTGVAEWYAPLYDGTIADEVFPGGRFPEGRIIGENSHLRNRLFGKMEAVERALFDDDQTGQIKQRAQRLGTSMAVTESIWSAYRFLGPQRTYGGLITVPASEYSTTNSAGTSITTPFSTTLYTGSTGNRPSTYRMLNVGNFKLAYVSLLNALDPMQNKVIVTPDTLLHSSMDKVNAELLTQPGYYPGVPGQSDAVAVSAPIAGGTTSAAGANQGVLAGFPGGAFQQNPFASLGIKPQLERYLPDWAWALGQKGRGFTMQVRDPMEITQEAPNSGGWFDFDVIRWRSRARWICDWIGGGSRFWYCANDGSVTGMN